MAATTTRLTKEVRQSLFNGDVAVFRNGGLIEQITGHAETHVERIVWAHDTVLVCGALWRGARARCLRGQVRRYPGRIDIYRPRCADVLREKMAQIAVRQLDVDYARGGLVWASLQYWPLVRQTARRLLPEWSDPRRMPWLSEWREPKFCSWLQAFVDRFAGVELGQVLGTVWDPWPTVPDRLIAPHDFARSPAYDLIHRGLVL